jgi:hypothetical protein
MSLFNVLVTIFLDPMYSSCFDPHIVRPVYDPFSSNNVPSISNSLRFIPRRLVISLHATFDIGRALVLSIVSICCVSCIRKLCILPAITANSVRIPRVRRTSACLYKSCVHLEPSTANRAKESLFRNIGPKCHSHLSS